MPAIKQQIRQIIADNNLSCVANIYSLLKDSFKDILQELMAAEPDASLSYEKDQKGDIPTSNKRNGHSPKTLKSRYVEIRVRVWASKYLRSSAVRLIIHGFFPISTIMSPSVDIYITPWIGK